jgi:sulfoxide reductase heme-binding subunit YedZ
MRHADPLPGKAARQSAKAWSDAPLQPFRRRALLLAITAAFAGGLLLLVPGRALLERFSMATGYLALLLVATTLAIGPLRVLQGTYSPPSINLRREVGIIAGTSAMVHMILGLQVHFAGDFVLYFFQRNSSGVIHTIRRDAFGIANHVGLIVAAIMLVLLSLSNNRSIRWLGPARWKAIQRWNYAGALLLVPHALLYQGMERRKMVFVVAVLMVAGAAASLQWIGLRRRRTFPAQSWRGQGLHKADLRP